MNYNKEVDVYTVQDDIADGLGGFERREVFYKKVKCAIAPTTISTITTENQLKTISSLKMFLKDKLFEDLDQDFKIIYKDKKYKKTSISDYEKCILVILERD